MLLLRVAMQKGENGGVWRMREGKRGIVIKRETRVAWVLIRRSTGIGIGIGIGTTTTHNTLEQTLCRLLVAGATSE